MDNDENSMALKEDIIKHDNRLCHLESCVSEIKETLSVIGGELRTKGENDVRMAMQVEIMANDMTEIKVNIKQMNIKLLDALIKGIDEDKKERKGEEKAERKCAEDDKDRADRARGAEIEFYRKLILGCLTIGATLIASAYGIAKLIPAFNM